MKQPLQGLYGITDSQLMPDDSTLLHAVEAALRGGMRLLQYRDKSQDRSRRLRQARALQALCHRYSAPLLINDDVELALAVGAAGVHLGQEDGCLEQARRLLGPSAIIGATCHDSLALAEQAATAGVDYLAFGRFYPSQTKPNARPADPDILLQAKDRFNRPVVAIGGIDLDRGQALISQGADLLAVVHGLFGQTDAEAQARAFARLFATDPRNRR